MNIPNAVLAERVRKNDSAAFAQLFKQHHSLVFAVCLKLLGHRQDAEDATQETFSRVARYIHRWDPTRPFEPWLVAIAGNRCRTQLSRRASFQPLALVSEPAADHWSTENSADSLQEELALVKQQLHDKHRIAFELFHEKSMSYVQIAQRLDCPVATAKTWVRRARAQLIESLIEREVVEQNAVTKSDATRGGRR